MAISSGFFNSIDGDRLYDAVDFTNYLDGLVTDGFFPGLDGLLVSQNTDTTQLGAASVLIKAGKVYKSGLWYNSTTTMVYMLGQTFQTVAGKKHLIYFKFDTSSDARNITIEHVTDDNPVIPVDSEYVSYMPLALVVDKLTANPTYGDITDLRVPAGVVSTTENSNSGYTPFPTGVISGLTMSKNTALDGIILSPGTACIEGVLYHIESPVTIYTTDGINNYFGLRLVKATKEILPVNFGDISGPGDLVRDSTIYEVILGYHYRAGGIDSLVDKSDERNYFGWVNPIGYKSLDSSLLNGQFQSYVKIRGNVVSIEVRYSGPTNPSTVYSSGSSMLMAPTACPASAYTIPLSVFTTNAVEQEHGIRAWIDNYGVVSFRTPTGTPVDGGIDMYGMWLVDIA